MLQRRRRCIGSGSDTTTTTTTTTTITKREDDSGGGKQFTDKNDDGTAEEHINALLPITPPLDPGRIINIGSVTGFIPQDAPTHAYDISKVAVHHLTKKLAADLAPRGITVNAIAPGYVLTRMSKGLVSWTKDGTLEEFTKSIPLGRMGNEEDMGGACLYLASRAGAWCTGVILNVDGGTVGTMQIPLSNL
jgi:NAD(P)-dependent dehydrogenase (short-subunit alcohol dehydrogenase family)